MSKKPAETDLVLEVDPTRTHPPIDEDVKLPRQVLLGVARAEALIAGRQPPPYEVRAASAKSEKAFPYPDAQIDAVLERWDQGKLSISDPEFGVIIELAREGARLIKAHRRGAQKPRKKSNAVTQRLEAFLQAFRELPPKFQRYPTGQKTIERLRNAVIEKLRLPDNDDVLPEATIILCIRELRPLIRLVQRGKMPPPGKRHSKPKEPSEQTRREMKRGAEVSARHAAAKAAATSPEPSRGSKRPIS
jgi:hypothetical protein